MTILPNAPRYALLLLLVFNTQATAAPPDLGEVERERLQYTASYQGLFSGALPVEIARVSLQLHPAVPWVDGQQARRASLQLTSEPFAPMETFYPIRFSYDSWFDQELKQTLAVNMRRESRKSRYELLWFDHGQGMVRRYRKDGDRASAASRPPRFLAEIFGLQQPELFRQRRALPLNGDSVLDRLAMLYALRQRPLVPGDLVELPVSNGKDLLGYTVLVEAREKFGREGEDLVALRLKFTPRFDDGEEGYVVRVWLSDDQRRLPLRFHSRALEGVIELNLESPTGAVQWREDRGSGVQTAAARSDSRRAAGP